MYKKLEKNPLMILLKSYWICMKYRVTQGRMTRTNAIDPPRTPDSMDTIADQAEMLESLENGYPRQEEVPVSPRSYLSMPSCKQFPSMRSVEPLSRVLEPVTVSDTFVWPTVA